MDFGSWLIRPSPFSRLHSRQQIHTTPVVTSPPVPRGTQLEECPPVVVHPVVQHTHSKATTGGLLHVTHNARVVPVDSDVAVASAEGLVSSSSNSGRARGTATTVIPVRECQQQEDLTISKTQVPTITSSSIATNTTSAITAAAPVAIPIVTAVAAIAPSNKAHKRKADSRESILYELYGGMTQGSVQGIIQSNQRRERVLLNPSGM